MYPKKVKPFAQILVTGLSKKKGVVEAYLTNIENSSIWE